VVPPVYLTNMCPGVYGPGVAKPRVASNGRTRTRVLQNEWFRDAGGAGGLELRPLLGQGLST